MGDIFIAKKLDNEEYRKLLRKTVIRRAIKIAINIEMGQQNQTNNSATQKSFQASIATQKEVFKDVQLFEKKTVFSHTNKTAFERKYELYMPSLI